MVFLEHVEGLALEAARILQLRPRPFPVDVVVRGEAGDPIVLKMLERRLVLYDGLGLFY